MCAEGQLRESISSRKGLRKRKERARKSLRSLRSPFAEADPEIQPKTFAEAAAESAKKKQALLAEVVVSVLKLYRNNNQNTFSRSGKACIRVFVPLNPKPPETALACHEAIEKLEPLDTHQAALDRVVRICGIPSAA